MPRPVISLYLSLHELPCFFLSICFLSTLILRSSTLHKDIQSQEYLPRNHVNHLPDYATLGQDAFSKTHSTMHKSLCSAEVGSGLLNSANKSGFVRSELMNLFLFFCSICWRPLKAPSPSENLYTLFATRTLNTACSASIDLTWSTFAISAIVIPIRTSTTEIQLAFIIILSCLLSICRSWCQAFLKYFIVTDLF